MIQFPVYSNGTIIEYVGDDKTVATGVIRDKTCVSTAKSDSEIAYIVENCDGKSGIRKVKQRDIIKAIGTLERLFQIFEPISPEEFDRDMDNLSKEVTKSRMKRRK